MGVFAVLSAVAVQGAATSPIAAGGLWSGDLASRMQQLSLTQLEALYSLLDDDGSGDVRHLLTASRFSPPSSTARPVQVGLLPFFRRILSNALRTADCSRDD
jgi:hypothetical protein